MAEITENDMMAIARDNMMHCTCGVIISPLFAFHYPQSKGRCPKCKTNLLKDSSFFEKCIKILSADISRPLSSIPFGDRETKKAVREFEENCLKVSIQAWASLKIIDDMEESLRRKQIGG